MSRRARSRELVREAKHADFYAAHDLSDVPDDDGPECRDDDPRCYVCGERRSVTDSGCAGHDGECYECPRW